MNLIKRVTPTIVAFAGASCLAIAGSSVFAATPSNASSTSSTALTTNQQQDLANLKTKGTEEIDRRITSLKNAENKISSSAKLSSSDKTYLQNEVNTEISGLNTLETTLNNETTLAAARTDVQNIFNDYRVYALVLPKTWLVTTADGELNTDAKLTTLATQLRTQITNDQNAGKTVTTLQTELNDMETQTKNASDIATSIENSVLTLQPTDYNGDHTILSGDSVQLKTGHADNQTAATDAKNIINGLKSL